MLQPKGTLDEPSSIRGRAHARGYLEEEEEEEVVYSVSRRREYDRGKVGQEEEKCKNMNFSLSLF
jgi:hypothetical protein